MLSEVTRLQFTDDTIELENLLMKQVSGQAAVGRFATVLLDKLPTAATAVEPELVCKECKHCFQ